MKCNRPHHKKPVIKAFVKQRCLKTINNGLYNDQRGTKY